MTDRRDEERERTRRHEQEDDVRRQEDSERRSDELREAWRRNHPRESQKKAGKPRGGSTKD